MSVTLDPYVVAAAILAGVFVVALIVILFKRPRGRVEEDTVVLTVLARLETVGGVEFIVTERERVFGRRDFEGVVPYEIARVISRRHFRLFYKDGAWFVEDLGSTNGTRVNGVEIRGKGPVRVRDGDVISLAGVLDLKFREALPEKGSVSERQG